MNEFFKIEKNGNITKFTNFSEYIIVISLKPIKPKRKYKDLFVVRAREFLIDEYNIDMNIISFRFEKIELSGISG